MHLCTSLLKKSCAFWSKCGKKMVNFSKVISTGIPALILLYVFYLIAFNVPQTYTIDIGTQGDMDTGSDAYIRDMTAQGRISQRMSLEDDTFRIMNGSPLYFHVTPKNSIMNDTRIMAQLKFRGDADLDISVYKAYSWKPFYIRSLDNYTLAKSFDDAVIYSIDKQSNYTDVDNMSDWISINIPKYSSIKLYDFYPDIFSPDILVNSDLKYNNETLDINQTFRGTHSFLIYIKDNLNLTLGKQDLNAYNGTDWYSVELYNLDGRLLFNETMQDDGIINDSKQKSSQSRTFFHDGIGEGLYELRLVNLKGGNKAADSTITKIRINTDKLLTQGTIYLLDPDTLYFELKRSAEIKINARQVQNISIRGALKKDVVIDKKLLNKWIPVELSEGSYNMSIKGDIYVSGANFAFTKGSLFQPYDYEINNESSDWVIISNYQVEKDKEGWITAKKMFRGSDLELQGNKTMVFGLRKKDNNEVTLDEFKVILTPR